MQQAIWTLIVSLSSCVFAGGVLTPLVCAAPPSASQRAACSPAIGAGQLERDWLAQARLRYGTEAGTTSGVTPAEDAAGGCDGVINGKWGFHTQSEANPWWQVDLGNSVSIDQLRIYNRCDGGFEERAARLKVLLSEDGDCFTVAYTHDGTMFRGHPDKKPLVVPLDGTSARFVKLQLPETVYFHLDEVQVLAADDGSNVALNKPATQSSVSKWSVRHATAPWPIEWPAVVAESIRRGEQLATALERRGVQVEPARVSFRRIRRKTGNWGRETDGEAWKTAYFQVRRATRDLALNNPLLDFERILFVKRAPTMFPHVSDQYYGWWARPGGGIYCLEGFSGDQPRVRCLTESWPTGNFLRPDLSHDASKVLFSFSRYEAGIADEVNKRDKDNVPEPVFYHLFELDLQTGKTRQITKGKYDDIDGRYLPTGKLLFLSTRKGQFLQCTQANARKTLSANLPDSYVRCGGNDYRPVPVFTMHTISRNGRNIRPVSAFETFEYTPSVANDGRLLYCRWDYIDRFNGHFFSLWSSNPDGTNAQLVYGNYTKAPQATLEPRSIPGSDKILFTAAAHHSITGGSLVLLDQAKGNEGEKPITRLTPEVPFPETEKNVGAYYANPWPLSEDFYLVSWSREALPPHGRYEGERNPVNAQGIYLCDRFGNLDLLHRDPDISSMTPIPVKPRPKPAVFSSLVDWSGEQVGRMVLQDIYQGLPGIERGRVKRLRIVGVVPKVQPRMNVPKLGVSREETGKFVMGSVPVHEDGSAYFQLPSGLPVFFQALDEQGMTLQTMRSLTYVQAGQTLSCVGCHEPRQSTPAEQTILATKQNPSPIRLGPEGTWPLRFDALVQPLLDRKCLECHQPSADDPVAAKTDLSSQKAWHTLLAYADNDLSDLVFERDRSIPGETPARQSRLLEYLRSDPLHSEIELTDEDLRRLAVWMDTYGHAQGAFSASQEEELREFRKQFEYLFEEPRSR
ncbi:MAG: discoidin domain-containing protein [Planctomycetota bacterium]